MKKLKLLRFFILLLCPLLLVGCELNNNTSNQNQGTSYSTVKVNYHYQYDVAIENYYQETYSVISGVSSEIDITYTPPIKLGYRFLGWTFSSGGKGDLISSKLEIVGVGAGSVYNLYAKYEIIPYSVVYHLNGGENNPNNPTELTGTKSLQSPTRSGYKFDGWYLEAEFTHRIFTLEMQDNDETTLHVYAKWLQYYSITYQSNIDNLPIEGDKAHTQYLEDDFYGFSIRLKNEHFENYLFLGWTYEGQSDPVKFDSVLDIPPKYNRNLNFVANYRKATSSKNHPGLEVNVDFNDASYIVPEDFVGEIVVPDISGKNNYTEYPVTKAWIYYYGEEPPTVIAPDGVDVRFFKRS